VVFVAGKSGRLGGAPDCAEKDVPHDCLDGAGPFTAGRSSHLMWAIPGLVLLADALDVFDGTVTNIAAQAIARELNGGVTLTRWLGPAYMPAMGVLLVVGGRLGDKFGQRRLL
jgi:hypothetical protein